VIMIGTDAKNIVVQDYVPIRTRIISCHSLECDSSINCARHRQKVNSFSTFLSVCYTGMLHPRGSPFLQSSIDHIIKDTLLIIVKFSNKVSIS